MMNTSKIIRSFDSAAASYDHAAAAQAEIAQQLVTWSAPQNPATILDVGCGTGFVAAAAHKRWPQAKITAMDAAPAMLKEAQRKVPGLDILQGDLEDFAPSQKFDVIYSSMALHWLPDPLRALRRWQSWLQLKGLLYIALPIAGSFAEWVDLCRLHDIEDGLWPLPPANFADGLALHTELRSVKVDYTSAQNFLHAWKQTGAATARVDHHPASAAKMRALLKEENHNFPLTYHLVFAEIAAPAP